MFYPEAKAARLDDDGEGSCICETLVYFSGGRKIKLRTRIEQEKLSYSSSVDHFIPNLSSRPRHVKPSLWEVALKSLHAMQRRKQNVYEKRIDARSMQQSISFQTLHRSTLSYKYQKLKKLIKTLLIPAMTNKL